MKQLKHMKMKPQILDADTGQSMHPLRLSE